MSELHPLYACLFAPSLVPPSLLADALRFREERSLLEAEFGADVAGRLIAQAKGRAFESRLNFFEALDECVSLHRQATRIHDYDALTTLSIALAAKRDHAGRRKRCVREWPLQLCEMSRQQRRALKRGRHA